MNEISTVRPLRRLIGATTATCVGIGVAVGSGILRTTGEVAGHIASPWLILLLWVAIGGVTLMQSLVTAELATRIPGAGGEYQYLRSAYGDFAGFFFGWSFTVFILGGGVGVIAAAAGDFAGELLHVGEPWTRIMACVFILVVTVVNAVGLNFGARFQNALTALKLTALVAIVIGAFWAGRRFVPITEVASHRPPGTVANWIGASLAVFWSFSGANESAKLAEEIRDVRRELPRALIASTLILTCIYVAVNYAILCVLPPSELSGQTSAAAAVFQMSGWPWARAASLIIGIVICLGCISSTLLSDVRVPFALARDGFAPTAMARMSARQSPTVSLVLAGIIGAAFALLRAFKAMLDIYFIASTILFGLTYASLIVYRVRERSNGGIGERVFRVPAGISIAVVLILIECAIAVHLIAAELRNPKTTYDSVWAVGLLGAIAIAYPIWRSISSKPQ